MAKTTTTVSLSDIFGLLTEVRDNGKTLAQGHKALTKRVVALEATRTEVTPETKAKVAKAVQTPEVTLGGEVRRCKAKTASGKRCKVTSRGDICGLHRAQAERQAAPVMTEPKVTKAKGGKAKAKTQVIDGKRVARGAMVGNTGLTQSEWNSAFFKAGLAAGIPAKAMQGEGWVAVVALRKTGLLPEPAVKRFRKAL